MVEVKLVRAEEAEHEVQASLDSNLPSWWLIQARGTELTPQKLTQSQEKGIGPP